MNNIFRLTGKDIELTAKKKKRICILSASAAVLAVVCAVTMAAGEYESRPEDVTDDLSAYRYEIVPEAESDTESTSDGKYNVTVTADGKTYSVLTSGTAADALSAAGIELGKHDIVTPGLSDALEEGMEIQVQRVVYYKKTKIRKLSYSTQYTEDDSIPAGMEKVITDGEKGEMVIRTITKEIDGEEVASKTVSKEVTSEPVDEVIARGTGSAQTAPLYASVFSGGPAAEETPDEDIPEEETEYSSEESETDCDYEEESEDQSDESDLYDDSEEEELYDDDTDSSEEEYDDSDEDYDADVNEYDEDTASDEQTDSDEDAYTYSSAVPCISELTPESDIALDENGIPVSYKEALHGKSCAYTAGEGALMSTGLCVDQGYVAVNPQIIPYGSKLYIVADDGEVYGYAIAADTGGSVGRNDILVDLFMWSYDACIQWGAKNVTIYVIE